MLCMRSMYEQHETFYTYISICYIEHETLHIAKYIQRSNLVILLKIVLMNVLCWFILSRQCHVTIIVYILIFLINTEQFICCSWMKSLSQISFRHIGADTHLIHANLQFSKTFDRDNINKAIRDGRPRPPRHQVGWDIVRRECACQISWWSVEKWRRYYILKFHGNTFRWPTTLTFDLKFWKYVYVKFHDDRLRNDWDITLWNFAKTRTNTRTNTHTNKQTWVLQYLALPLWGAR